MEKCGCYKIRAERRYFSDYDKGYAAAQGRQLPDCEDTYVGICLGTKEVDRCSCGGDRSKCDFYENVRQEAQDKNQSLNTTYEQAFSKIENLIGNYWGVDPIYYTDSKDKSEADYAKLCCKILEAIRISQEGEIDEKDS